MAFIRAREAGRVKTALVVGIPAALIIAIAVLIVGQMKRAAQKPPVKLWQGAGLTTAPALPRDSPALSYKKSEPMAEEAARAITQDLQSDDGAKRAAAIALVRQQMVHSPDAVAKVFANQWVEPLMAARSYQEVADWSLVATCCIPRSPLGMVEMNALLENRVRALLALHRVRDAQGAAKGYYNFVRLSDTQRAVDLLIESLRADPQTAALAEKFEAEQSAGAATTQPAASSVLPTIHVDPEPYLSMCRIVEADVVRLRGMELYRSYLQRGNRLLLADKVDEAQKCFEEGLKLCEKRFPKWQTMVMAECVARCIRAKDGASGRAEAHVAAEEARIDALPEPGAGQ